VSLVDAVGGPGGRPKSKWKPLFFILAEGKLSWFNADGRDAKLQGVVSHSLAVTAICLHTATVSVVQLSVAVTVLAVAVSSAASV
jgi:hypothetical protein